MAVISDRVVRECLGSSFDMFFFLPADGTRGGILLAWQSARVSVSHPHYTENAITARISIGVDQSWWFTGVYGPQRDVDKRAFLQELQDIRDLHVGPWLVAGDFNLIVDQADKSRGCLHRTMMGRFRRTLSALELKELYLNGRRFTWSNEREQPTLEKLDRVFLTVDWEDLYPDAFLSAMSTGPSDHCPLVLSLALDLHRGRRFQFQSFWPKVDGFLEVVQGAWVSLPEEPNPFKRLDLKLRATAKSLSSWSSKFIGNIKMQILLATEVILRLDVAMDSRLLSPEERALRRLLKKKLLGLASLERTLARQRSCLLWLREGDACTRFFHTHASHRRRKNLIGHLLVDNRRVTDHMDKSEAVDSFFEDLLGTSGDRPFSLDLDYLGIPSIDLSEIDGEFSVEEVWNAIKGMPLDKCPGPDGFSARFFVVCWDIIKVDVMAAFNSLSRLDSRGFGAVNSALITLLPKRPGAEEVKDFRPISLIHGIAKWVAKVIANRLAPLLPQLVGSHQSAFVRGRCLHDNFMMVQGTARKLHASKQSAILLKLDITKAFDTVDWSFLLEVLRKMGFGDRLLACICALLSTASTRVLLNGSPGSRVANRRGLRQGDPLSPQLFILVMEVLHFMLDKETQDGLLMPLAATGLRQRTSIYADDVVTFLRPRVDDLRIFAAIVGDFGVASGLRTNLNKCSAHLIRCSMDVAAHVDRELGCPVLPFPLRYLGLPLGLRKPTAAQLQYLVDAVANRLPGWRASMLNRAGRLELIRSTLAAVSIFAMMSLDVQIETLLAIEKILRGFLWKGRKDVHGGHCLVAWDRVCMPKEFGGLGIPNLRKMNLALRARWLWLSRVEASRPWKEFEIQVPPTVTEIFEAATYSVVGDGSATFFWLDSWLPDGRLKDLAPHLFALIPRRLSRARLVKDALDGGWLDDIPPDLDAPAIEELLAVADRVEGLAITEGVADAFRWSWGGMGSYSAKSCYLGMFRGEVAMAGALQVWKSRAPAKCRFFLWLVLRDRCWTTDRLERRGLPRPLACPFCDQTQESIAHLLLGCVLARSVWAACLRWWGRVDRLPTQMATFVDWLRSWHGRKDDLRDFWTGIALVCWCLWKHRNDIVFEGASPSSGSVIQKILAEAEVWRVAGLFRAGLASVDRWRVHE